MNNYKYNVEKDKLKVFVTDKRAHQINDLFIDWLGAMTNTKRANAYYLELVKKDTTGASPKELEQHIKIKEKVQKLNINYLVNESGEVIYDISKISDLWKNISGLFDITKDDDAFKELKANTCPQDLLTLNVNAINKLNVNSRIKFWYWLKSREVGCEFCFKVISRLKLEPTSPKFIESCEKLRQLVSYHTLDIIDATTLKCVFPFKNIDSLVEKYWKKFITQPAI